MDWVKQHRCVHEYFKVATEVIFDYRGDEQHVTHLYCPKCDKSIELANIQADLLLRRQEIKKEFNKFG